MIKNATQFITRWSQEMTPISNDLEESQKSISKAVFKDTMCGAWFAWCRGNSFIRLPKPYGVKIGSIVEGSQSSETNAPTQVLNFPFTWDNFWHTVSRVKKEAKELWMSTHGCNDCWSGSVTEEEVWDMAWPVDPDCWTCGGMGRE